MAKIRRTPPKSVDRFLVVGVTGDYCGACDESILDFAETKRTMALMFAFNQQVNMSLEDISFIIAARKKLNLDQREAA